ncbi:DPP IV N-terminal domain-containing protein [Sphingopyxis fribergensis]
MTIKTLIAALAASTLLVAAPAAAQGSPQQQVDKALELRDSWLYLTENVPFPAQWVKGTNRFVYRKTVPGGFNYVMVDAATMQKQPAFDHERLAAGLGKATGNSYTALKLPFANFEFSDDGRDIRIRMGERGNWTCSLADYGCKPLLSTKRPRGYGVVRDLTVPANNTPKASPDGRWVAYVSNDNIAIRPAGGDEKIISTDGSPGEFYDPESIVWSPDSKKVAAYRVRPGYSRLVYKVDSTPDDQSQPKLTTQLYPKPGDAVDIDRPVIFHVDTGRQVNVPHALFENPYSMSELSWRKDSGALNFEFDERGHKNYRRIAVDPETGAARVEAQEAANSFVNSYVADRRYSHDVDGQGRELIWSSERDGWNHLYLYDAATGKVRNQITKGNWIVRKVVEVDDQKRQIYFAASGMKPDEDPYFQYYYRIDFDGRNLTPLTAASASHDASFSSDLAYYVDTYSRIDQAPVSELRRSDGTLVAVIDKGDVTKLTQAGYKPPEPFVAKGRDGKSDIWGIIVRPQDFDPAKQYPVVEYIYAGPHDSFVPKTYWPFGNSFFGSVAGMQALADTGFVVVQIDGMGTMNRSKAFHDVAWKNVGDSGFPDRILWHKAAAAKFPWYDTSRVGIYGASAGGQSTLGALLFHPEFYKAGISFNGCYDNRMDKIAWNEAWMGWPVDESYSRSSGVDNAWRLQGRLKLVVGELDTNVDPSSTYQVADALVKAHKDFEMVVVPGESHGALRNGGIDDVYGQRMVLDFFLRNLAGQPVPNWNPLTPATGPASRTAR